ncbi:MraY family glycosyltransferase [Halopseudomonas bauzanensis]|uniref:Fuc2NAc and GlcNAc transferase n=1 Tax=Halopseudomonas bauzanensis TaxID=653930 RepID=A0A1H9QYU7_9GAMM|nr:glycosyltransferase family 4 protein [Halopseudomonas bauzanensis]SER65640.1 Fuc2NAc and GlcNAc transferase [Halopseudomonas bauzanensis]SFL62221.1 Fuc2NAc and GlcNAc transferase [Halopseudomonas bauzanensis]
MSLYWWLMALVGVSWFLTRSLRRYALSRSLIDIPNARSSHSIPTPRGGGVAIVLAYLAVLPVVGYEGWLSWPMVIGLMGAGAWVAVIGFLDDHGHIAARWRLLAHFMGAAWLLAWLPELPRLAIAGTSFDLGLIGYLLAALMLVWLLNLYNFMDGIDGIASVEAITVCAGGALLYALLGMPMLAAPPLLLAGAVAGFLVWNFPPARIFMGDAGSGFLGVVLGGLALQAAWVAPQLLWAWLILLGVFVLDATFTLLRRLMRGDKVYEAHRSHAYQYASRQYGAHLPVTMAVLAINILWLLPWACVVALGYIDGLLALLIAYLPLALLAVRFNAGQLEKA